MDDFQFDLLKPVVSRSKTLPRRGALLAVTGTINMHEQYLAQYL